jgi:hypothetical protein
LSAAADSSFRRTIEKDNRGDAWLSASEQSIAAFGSARKKEELRF